MASPAAQEWPTGNGDWEGFGGSSGGQAAPLHPILPHIPCAYPALPCYGWLSSPPLSLLTQKVSAPRELPRPPVWLPGPPLLYPALLHPGTPGDPSMGAKAAAASRENTAALKAWLGRHRKNPYPSKGEKVLLALVSRMSLTQVSTWFANARRRLKKDSRARWPPRRPSKAEGSSEEGEAEEEERAAPSPSLSPPGSPGTAPPWPRSSPAAGMEPLKPKIWCVAELATSPQAGGAAA